MTRTPAQIDRLAARIVARVMAANEPSQQAALLASMIAHSAAGLRIAIGAEHAAEAVYSVADQVVAREVV